MSGRGETIRTVVVDDDPVVLRLHERYVRQIEGFTVVGTAVSGAAATAHARAGGIDLMLLDMRLPDFSGVEVINRIRGLHAWGVDVIVVSSARDPFTVRQSLAGAVADYLVKPATPELFRQRLERYRDRRRARVSEGAIDLGQGEIDALLGALQPVRDRAGSALVGASSTADGVEDTADEGVEGAAGLPTGPTPGLAVGLSAATMTAVRRELVRAAPATARELAQAVGCSRSTIRRYLDELTRLGQLDLGHRFGKRGRPEIVYRPARGMPG